MKKISIFAAGMAAMFGLASCESTTDPKLQVPEQDVTAVSFQINEPVYASQELQLQNEDEATFDIQVYSQPDYGFPAAVTYTAQVSLSGNLDKPSEVYDINYDVVQSGEANHTVVMTQKSLATAITALNGYSRELVDGVPVIYDPAGQVYTGPTEGLGPQKVYIRAVAQIGDVESTKCYSNAIELKKVSWFINTRDPGYIYLIGSPQGWNIGDGSMMLFEADDEIGTKVYRGSFNIAADASLGFRFYTELGDWGSDGSLPSIGAAANDGDNKDVTFGADGTVSTGVVYGKGNFQFPNWPGGMMYIVVDLNSMQVTFSDHEL